MKYGFIGTGNMGGALARAVSASVGGEAVVLADRDSEKAKRLAEKLGARVETAEQAAKGCDFLFLGVKPQMMAEMLAGIRGALAENSRLVLVSMAAGLSMAEIRRLAGGEYPVIRIMPNTPASIGQGMILYDCTENVTDAQVAQFLQAMERAGRLDRLPEKLIDAGSAVSGCGPAFVFLMIEALADGGVECGLPRAKALTYAAQTLMGSAALMLTSGEHPGVLKDAVCSPGGTTIAGVHALESHGFRAAAMDAVCAAYRRTKELAK